MAEANEKVIRSTLSNVTKWARVLKLFFTLCIIFLGCFWLFTFGTLIVNVISPNLVSSISDGSSGPLIKGSIQELIVVGVLFLGRTIFSDMSKGISPFVTKQVIRIRIAAVAFLACALLNMLVPLASTSLVISNDAYIGLASGMDSTFFLNVDVGMLMSALLFFCLSVVFKYGSTLQRLSDDTV